MLSVRRTYRIVLCWHVARLRLVLLVLRLRELVVTAAREVRRNFRDLWHRLEQVEAHSLDGVARHVAVDEPQARVGRAELGDGVAARRHDDGLSQRWPVEVHLGTAVAPARRRTHVVRTDDVGVADGAPSRHLVVLWVADLDDGEMDAVHVYRVVFHLVAHRVVVGVDEAHRLVVGQRDEVGAHAALRVALGLVARGDVLREVVLVERNALRADRLATVHRRAESHRSPVEEHLLHVLVLQPEFPVKELLAVSARHFVDRHALPVHPLRIAAERTVEDLAGPGGGAARLFRLRQGGLFGARVTHDGVGALLANLLQRWSDAGAQRTRPPPVLADARVRRGPDLEVELLARMHGDEVHLDGNDVGAIERQDPHVVLVDADDVRPLRRRVDDAEAVEAAAFYAEDRVRRLQALVAAAAVDQTRLVRHGTDLAAVDGEVPVVIVVVVLAGAGMADARRTRHVRLLRLGVVPVADERDELEVRVRGLVRRMDDDGSEQPATSLVLVVVVVPVCADGRRLEAVRE